MCSNIHFKRFLTAILGFAVLIIGWAFVGNTSAYAAERSDADKTITLAAGDSIQDQIDYIKQQPDKDGWTINLAPGASYDAFFIYQDVTGLTVNGNGATVKVREKALWDNSKGVNTGITQEVR